MQITVDDANKKRPLSGRKRSRQAQELAQRLENLELLGSLRVDLEDTSFVDTMRNLVYSYKRKGNDLQFSLRQIDELSYRIWRVEPDES
jgi:hypothetical protein